MTAQHLVANYLGVALLPRMAIDASPPVPGIVTLPTSPATYREIFVTAGHRPGTRRDRLRRDAHGRQNR